MAVFVCASDESADQDPGNFFYGGWAASVDVWENVFAPAWNERVLDGPPQIPYLHMTDIRDWNWQDKFGLTRTEASRRLDEASRVIRSTGAIVPVSFTLKRSEYDQIIANPFRKDLGKLDPDYLCFQWFAFTQLDWLHHQYRDEVERVDFWVEQNGDTTRNMKHFHGQLADGLNFINRSYLVPLIGEFHEVGKDRIPVQAADMLGWHTRNMARQALGRSELRRYWRMTEGGLSRPRVGRYGHRGRMDVEAMRGLAERFAEHLKKEKGASGGSAA